MSGENYPEKKGKFKQFLEWIGVHLHIHPKFYILFAILSGGFLALLVGLFFYSTSPSFCNSCHIMKPYYQAWKTSKHNQVACVQCHMPPQRDVALWAKFQSINHVVQLITKKYSSKPYAQIEDASCLRPNCHSTNILAGKITFKKGVRFDHKFHLGDLRRGKQLRCTSCHGQIVVGTHIEVTESTCYLCHFKQGEGQVKHLPLGDCTTCHEIPQKDIKFQGFTFNHLDFVGARHVSCEKCHRDVIQGNGYAPRERCYTCHNQPERLIKYNDITYIHESHVTNRKVDCNHCHEEIKHGLKDTPARFMEYNCEVCHKAIHNGPREMFMGEGGKKVSPHPSHMFTARLDCLACHVQPKGAELGMGRDGWTLTASEETCVNCHGNKYQGMLKDWKDTFDLMLRDINQKLDLARQVLEKQDSASSHYREAKKLYADAKYNIDFVKIGKGVHNPFYAAELIQVADRDINELFRLLKQSPPPLPPESPIRGGYCAQLCHTKARVQMPAMVYIGGDKFPHARHAFEFNLGCTSCHSAEKHKEIKISKKDCLACHHSPDNKQCSRCHQKQFALYTAQNLPTELPSAKASRKAGKVECVQCHDLSKSQNLENISLACGQCHDLSYIDLFNALQKEIQEGQKKIADLLPKVEKKLKFARRTDPQIKETIKLFEQAQKAYEFVLKAKGIHHPELAQEILEKAQKDLQQVITYLDAAAKKDRRKEG
ncbi:MAG: multiheme c-type cytochrome [Thermodesulfobacteriota bacterium]